MALLNSLFSGISGLRNHQTMMDVIGNNISNANTIGFKSSRITFSDTFNRLVKTGTNPTETSGGTNSFQIGLGVKTNSIDRNWSQGTIETTGTTTDLALSGPGLFVLKQDGQNVYSKAGAFVFDEDGRLVNPSNGALVQGKVANSEGIIPPGNNLQDVQIDMNMKLPAEPTSLIEWGGNLDADSTQTRTKDVEVKGNIKKITGLGGPTQTTEVTVYNDYGEEYTLQVNLDENATVDNQYELTWNLFEGDDTSAAPVISSAAPLDLTFDAVSGDLDAASQALVENITVDAMTVAGVEHNVQFNLDASALSQTLSPNSVSSLADGGEEPNIISSSITVYDSLGNAHDVSIEFTKSADDANTWLWRAQVPPSSRSTGDPEYVSGTIQFNSDGSLDPTENISLAFAPPSGADPMNIELDFGSSFSGLTQTVGSSTLSAISQNGAPSASLTNLNIDQYGNIEGIFSNGKTQKLAQVMIATFKNLNGLVSIGNNMYVPRPNSGEALIGEPGDDTATTVQSGALEQSNVDLSEEFTKMIISQRGFQANARVISTSDNILQEITNLVR